MRFVSTALVLMALALMLLALMLLTWRSEPCWAWVTFQQFAKRQESRTDCLHEINHQL